MHAAACACACVRNVHGVVSAASAPRLASRPAPPSAWGKVGTPRSGKPPGTARRHDSADGRGAWGQAEGVSQYFWLYMHIYAMETPFASHGLQGHDHVGTGEGGQGAGGSREAGPQGTNWLWN